jgi:F-type H+-transporting ATPase subunit b
MTRQPVLALGLLALAIAMAPARPASADEPQAKSSPAAVKHETSGHETAAPGAPAHPAGEENPDVLKAEVPLAMWTVIVFVLLLLILGKYAWKPMLKALHDREEHIEHCLLEAERARNEAERLIAENQKNLANAADQVRAMIDAARKDAEAAAAGIVQKAQAEAEASLERAKREIGNERDQALAEIFNKTADLAVAVAGKVLSKNLNADDQRRMIDSAMAELPALTNGVGGRA